MTKIVVASILLIFPFVSFSSVNVNIGLDIDFDPIEIPAETYEVEQLNDHGITSISRTSLNLESNNLPAYNIIEGKGLTIYYYSDGIRSLSINESGNITSQSFPQLKNELNGVDAAYIAVAEQTIYVRDDVNNTILKFVEESDSWVDLREELTFPEGQITHFQTVESRLVVVVETDQNYELWEISPQTVLISESDIPIDWVYEKGSLITLNRGVNLVGHETGVNKPRISFIDGIDTQFEFEEGLAIFPYFLDKGILISQSREHEDEFSHLYWISYKDRKLVSIDHPSLATVEHWCISKAIGVICQYESERDYLYYRVIDGKMELDSVISKDILSGVDRIYLQGFYGSLRFIGYFEGDKRKQGVIVNDEVIDLYSVDKIESFPPPMIIDAENKQAFLFERVSTSILLSRIDFYQTSSLEATVSENEYPEYRKLGRNDSSDTDDEGIGSLGFLYLWLGLGWLFSSRNRA